MWYDSYTTQVNHYHFPVQNRTTHDKSHTAGLQTFLLNYHIKTKDIIKSHGKGTADAVATYQDLRGLSVDGSCGNITWKDIQTQIRKCKTTTSNGWESYRLNATYYNSGKS